MSARDVIHPDQFHPSALSKGDVVDVPTQQLYEHPDVWRDERDPLRGGVGSGMNQRGMDTVVPGHRLSMAEGEYADIDTYLGELGHSMATQGQQNPIILARQPDQTFWIAEGNHRLAAAMRAGLPTVRVTRGGDFRENQRSEEIESSASVRGPSENPVARAPKPGR